MYLKDNKVDHYLEKSDSLKEIKKKKIENKSPCARLTKMSNVQCPQPSCIKQWTYYTERLKIMFNIKMGIKAFYQRINILSENTDHLVTR